MDFLKVFLLNTKLQMRNTCWLPEGMVVGWKLHSLRSWPWIPKSLMAKIWLCISSLVLPPCDLNFCCPRHSVLLLRFQRERRAVRWEDFSPLEERHIPMFDQLMDSFFVTSSFFNDKASFTTALIPT